MRSHVVSAVFKRNVASYFSGVLGYLFIVVFVIAGSLLAFRSEFFAANQANLDPLTEWYPLLLVFIVPAVTMTAWADERKLGTDELLFTLPATDV
ncbi:MAG: ABC transporter permease, partial [Planctomycetaceae bacterium]